MTLFALFVPWAFAKSEDTCYSVQVKSFHIKNSSSYDFYRKGYPSSCKLMKLSSMYAVRCGCFDSYYQAENALNKISEIYYDAIIVNTYRYRFGDEVAQSHSEPITSPKKEHKRDYNSNNDSFYERYNSIDVTGDSRTKNRDDYENGESSFDNDFEDSDDLSEYGYE